MLNHRNGITAEKKIKHPQIGKIGTIWNYFCITLGIDKYKF